MKRRVIRQYEFIRKIGSGGSGVVFLANDTLLQRPVVLKLLKRGVQTAEQVRATQLREARLASAIDHPNVCAIYEVGEEDEEAYIVMQYIPGKSLDKVIAEGPANVQLVLSSGMQIADGLQAAHSLGIFHRDLKPANVMLTDGGLIKILDFGLARQLKREKLQEPNGNFDPVAARAAAADCAGRDVHGARWNDCVHGAGAVCDGAEQRAERHLCAGADPVRDGERAASVPSAGCAGAAEHSRDPVCGAAVAAGDCSGYSARVGERDSALPGEAAVGEVCVGGRGARGAEDDCEVAAAGHDGDGQARARSTWPAQQRLDMETPEEEKRTTGILSMLAERFRESTTSPEKKDTDIVVLPFVNLGTTEATHFYGQALADAVATRLAKVPSLVVRPSSALMNIPTRQLDPLSVGRRLLVDFVLTGSFLRSEQGFDLNWQLLDVPRQSVRTGGAISVKSFDLIAVQTEICDEVFAELQGRGGFTSGAGQAAAADENSLGGAVSEEYLQARALLSSFMTRTGNRDELDRARELFERVVARDPGYAPGWSGLGITHLQYARHGMGGQMHVLEARRAFDRALERDPDSVEANLYRVYMLLSRGEKESARHGIEHLLQEAANDWNVHLVAGITLRNRWAV